MPLKLTFFLIVSLIALNLSAQVIPKYEMRFQYRDSIGLMKDTIMSRAKYLLWSKSEAYPSFVKWKSLPFAVLRSSISGVGLFTDSSSSFSLGQQIGFAFVKRSTSGRFNFDYIETNFGSFINDSETPNMDVELTDNGVVFKSNQSIPPHTELTVSYRAIIDLFPDDETAEQSIKYW